METGQERAEMSAFLFPAIGLSIAALVFALMALATAYFEEFSEDAVWAWSPFSMVCSFLTLGALGATRATQTLRATRWQRRLSLSVGAVFSGIALTSGVVGVWMAPSDNGQTFVHGEGWLWLSQAAAITGAAWLIFAPPGPEEEPTST